MDINSKEHQQLIIRSILKVSIKTMTLGLVVGLILMAPSFVRENAFSQGLFWVGFSVLVVSIVYALGVAFKKFRMVRSSFTNI